MLYCFHTSGSMDVCDKLFHRQDLPWALHLLQQEHAAAAHVETRGGYAPSGANYGPVARARVTPLVRQIEELETEMSRAVPATAYEVACTIPDDIWHIVFFHLDPAAFQTAAFHVELGKRVSHAPVRFDPCPDVHDPLAYPHGGARSAAKVAAGYKGSLRLRRQQIADLDAEYQQRTSRSTAVKDLEETLAGAEVINSELKGRVLELEEDVRLKDGVIEDQAERITELVAQLSTAHKEIARLEYKIKKGDRQASVLETDKDDLRRRLDAFVMREAAKEKQLAAQEDAARCRLKALKDRQEVLQRRDEKLALLAERQAESRERCRDKRARMDQDVLEVAARIKLASTETETEIVAEAKMELAKVNNKHIVRARRKAADRQKSEEEYKADLGHAAAKWAALSAENETLKGDMEKLLRELEQGDKFGALEQGDKFGALPGSSSGAVTFTKSGDKGKLTRYSNTFFAAAAGYLALGAKESNVVDFIKLSAELFGVDFDCLPKSNSVVRSVADALYSLNLQCAGESMDLTAEETAAGTRRVYTCHQDTTGKQNGGGKVDMMGTVMHMTDVDKTGKILGRKVVALPLTQCHGHDADNEASTLAEALQMVGEFRYDAAGAADKDRYLSKIDFLMSDGASVATRVNGLMALKIQQARADKSLTDGQRAEANKVHVLYCEMHGCDNATRAIVEGIDLFIARRLKQEGASKVFVDRMQELEMTGAGKSGWSSFIYQMWKLLFDKTYVFAAAHEFLDWLSDDDFHTTKMADDPERVLALQLAKDCGRIVGGRFVQDHRASMTLFPLLDLIDAFTQHLVATKSEETKTNKLVQTVLAFMKEPWRKTVVAASSLLCCQVMSPWIHEIKIQNTPMMNGVTWRFVDSQIKLLDLDDAQVLAQRLRDGDPMFESSGWKTLNLAKVSQKKLTTHKAAEAVVQEYIRSAPPQEFDACLDAIRHCLVFLEKSVEHYGRDHIGPGARFHPDNLSAEDVKFFQGAPGKPVVGDITLVIFSLALSLLSLSLCRGTFVAVT